jgi:hypothetical protein
LSERLEGRAPSGLGDLPRPFVFRAAHLDSTTISRGQVPLRSLFDTRDPAIDVHRHSLAWRKQGLAPPCGDTALGEHKWCSSA